MSLKTGTIECHLHTDETERCVYVKYIEGELYTRRTVLDQEETSLSLLFLIVNTPGTSRFLFIRNI